MNPYAYGRLPQQAGNPLLNVRICFLCIGLGLWWMYRKYDWAMFVLTGKRRDEPPKKWEEVVNALEREHTDSPAKGRNLPPTLLPRRHPSYVYDVGLRYENLGDYEQAMALFLQVVRVRPTWAEPRYHLALAFARLHRNEDAWEQYRLLQDLDHELANKLYRYLTEFHLV